MRLSIPAGTSRGDQFLCLKISCTDERREGLSRSLRQRAASNTAFVLMGPKPGEREWPLPLSMVMSWYCRPHEHSAGVDTAGGVTEFDRPAMKEPHGRSSERRPCAVECSPGCATTRGFAGGTHRDPAWILVEEGFTVTREHELELLFAIGNGYAGSRSSLAEGSALSAPATFVAGVFDSEAGSVPGLVPTADWTACQPPSTATRFGSIGATTWSTVASSTCDKESSGGSGGIRTMPVGLHSSERCASPPWPTVTCWFNV